MTLVAYSFNIEYPSCHVQVSDCASHPADIKVQQWSKVVCASCHEQDYGEQDPIVSCAEADDLLNADDDVSSSGNGSRGNSSGSSSSSSSSGNGVGGDDDGVDAMTPVVRSAPVASEVGLSNGKRTRRHT